MSAPSPLVFSPSQLWHGNDGNWSSFIVRVGTPEQNFYVLPSAATGEVIVPHAIGCQPSEGDPNNCAALRGVFDSNHEQGFLANSSVSWQADGFFGMGLEAKIGCPDDALYGKDTVGLMIQNSGGVSLQNQTVGAVRKLPFFVGFFGLSPKASNFTDYDRPRRSYLTTLKDEQHIPSLSYAYNAGTYYTTPKVFGSLTMGGFDEGRFLPNNITFPFDADDERPTSLKLQEIIAKNTFNGSVVLLEEETYVNLDFTMPHLLLPKETCDLFASRFQLTYDNTTDLYLINDATHSELIARNPHLTFTFGDLADPAGSVDIILPYAAFDLQASWPTYNDTKRYFPIRRANDSSQYTLGRAFMQEAYIIVDYERGNFSLHQAAFPASNEQKIVAISSKDAPAAQGKHGLSQASIAGIVTGSTVFVALMIVLAILMYRRRKRSHTSDQPKFEHWNSNDGTQPMTELPDNKLMRYQLMSSEVLELQVSGEQEVDSKAKFELE